MSGVLAEVFDDDALALAESAHALVQSDAAAAAQLGERAPPSGSASVTGSGSAPRSCAAGWR